MPARRQRVVDPSDKLGGFDVDGVLIAKRASLDPDDKSESLDMMRQVLEFECDLFVLVQVEEFEPLEVADQQEAG